MKKMIAIGILAGVFSVVSLTAGEEKFRMGPGMWEAFASMNDAERAALMKLQREEPEKFRAELEARAETIYREKLARYEEMQKLLDRYAASATDAEKTELKTQLRKKLAENFDNRLAWHRRQTAAMKRRAENIEKQLDSRAARRDEILDSRLDALLTGKEKLHTPQRKNPPPKPSIPVLEVPRI